VWNVDAGQRVVGQQFDLAAIRTGFKGAAQAQAGDGTPMPARVHQDRTRPNHGPL